MKPTRIFFGFMRFLRKLLSSKEITLKDELYTHMFCHHKSKDIGTQLFYDAEIK